MIEFLVDNIYVRFGGQLFRQMVGIPMGTNCAPLLADLFFYSYENEFLDKLIKEGKRKLARKFNLSYCYFDDIISFNNKRFKEFISDIYPKELTISETTESTSVASYLDLLFTRGKSNNITTKLYDKRDAFGFHIVNFPFMSSNIPSAPAYGVYASQLIRYASCCSNYSDFSLHHRALVTRLLSQEIVKCGFWCKLPLFAHFCGAPMQMMKISDFPIYSFTNGLLPSSLYNLAFMKGPNCAP